MLNNLTKKGCYTALTILLLIALVCPSFILILQPAVASAAVSQAKMISGIDYSGKGTIIQGKQLEETPTVDGDYLIIPTYTNGAYTYSNWDAFWAGWSGWSPSNKSYFDYKGYDYKSEHKIHITDAQEKTEYVYRRWNSDLNPYYRTRYFTQYKQVTYFLFIPITTYTTESSLSSYPGAKSGKTIVKRWTEQELAGYKGGYEYTGYRDGAPFTWPWETKWSAHSSRSTYRYKAVNLKWDADYKVHTAEKVPLNYSLYDIDGNPIKLGAKWTYSAVLSNHNRVFSDVTATRYVLNTDGIIHFLNIASDESLSEILLTNGYSSLTEFISSTVVNAALLPANLYLGVLGLVVQTIYSGASLYAQQKMQNNFATIKNLLAFSSNYFDENGIRMNLVFDFYQDIDNTPMLYSNVPVNREYKQFNYFVSANNVLSLAFEMNEKTIKNTLSANSYGTVSYISSTEELVEALSYYGSVILTPSPKG